MYRVNMDDWELLQAYCGGSESAFAELVRRHLNAVYSTALRRVGQPEAARDVCQRVFGLLATKASTLRPTGSLLGWLHRAAVHVASETLRNDRRRHAREQEAGYLNSMPQDSAADDAWHQLAPHLDTALLDLPEADRQAVLLRFFERLPLAEVGRRLGTTEAAAKMRVGRAVARLRERLTARGLLLTSAMLVGLLGERTVVAAPAGYVDGILASALSKTGTGIPPVATGLLSVPKLSLPLAGVVTALLLGTLAVITVRQGTRPVASSSVPGESAAPVLSPASARVTASVPADPLDDPAALEQAIERLREVIRRPFDRQVPIAQLQEAVDALGRHASKAVPMVLAELESALDLKSSKAETELQQKLQIRILAVESLRCMGGSARDALPWLMEWYRKGGLAELVDSLPMLLVDLGPDSEQSWELIRDLAGTSTQQGPFDSGAVVRLTELHPQLLPDTIQLLESGLPEGAGDSALTAARILAQLPGSDPEKVRPVLDRFLMLPELRDPGHYLPVTRDNTTDMTPVTQQGFDDQKRYMAAAALAALGESARDSLPALAELARRTTNEQVRERVFQTITALDPDRRFETPELAAARSGWEQDQAFFDTVKAGTAELEDLRQGLTRSRTAGAAATLLAKRGDAARDLAPELLEALTRTGSYEVAQALKTLAPDQLVHCLKNPAAFTPTETYQFKVHPERDALVEAAQALAELGPAASFALPALREALETPDRAWVRLTLDKAIRTIDPRAPQSVFTGGSISPLSLALVNARTEAEQAGNADRARLADATAMRMELNHGMTRKELIGIAAELRSADPELYAVYRQALVGAIPDLQSSLAGAP